MKLVLEVTVKTAETLKKLEEQAGKRVFVTEVFEEVWQKLSEQTLNILIRHLEN
jgi:DNA-binding response OmpR family regulator